jgi:hypothetical protein
MAPCEADAVGASRTASDEGGCGYLGMVCTAAT